MTWGVHKGWTEVAIVNKVVRVDLFECMGFGARFKGAKETE